jgi:hypothetical protein
MDNQDQHPIIQPDEPIPVSQPMSVSQSTAPLQAQATTKPQLEVPDTVAQSLLAINGAESQQKTKLRLPIGLLVTIGVVITLLIIASYLLGGVRSAQNPQNTNTSTSSQNGDSQVNQDVKSCSNIVNAVSEC